MQKLLKILIALVAVLALVVVAAALLLPKFIDINDYREEFAHLVQEKAGVTVRFQGPIEWSVFPWLGLAVEQVSLQDPNESTIATLGKAEISVRLLPLLKKQIETKTVVLHELDVQLIKDKEGKGNWELLQASASSKTTEAPEANPGSQTSPNSVMPGLNIASIEFKDLRLSFADQATGDFYLIDGASLETGAIVDNQPFPVAMKARLHSKQQDITLGTQLNTILGFNQDTKTLSLDNLKVVLQPGNQGGESLTLDGQVRFTQTDNQMTGSLAVAQFNPARFLSQLNMSLPPMTGPNVLEQLSLDAQFNSGGKSFTVEELNLTLDNLTLDNFTLAGHLAISDFEKPAIRFNLTGNDLNLDPYLPSTNSQESAQGKAPADNAKQENTSASDTAKAPSQEQEPILIPEETLRSLDLDGTLDLNSLEIAKLRFDKPSIKLKSANAQQSLQIDSGFYQGTIDVDGQLDLRTKGEPGIRFDTTVKSINLAALAEPIPAMKSIEGTANANAKLTTQGLVQSDLIRHLNGQGQFAIEQGAFTQANFDRLVCEGISRVRKKELKTADWGSASRFQDLSGSFTVRNGVASNNDLTAALSSLNLKGDGSVNLVQQTLDYHLSLNISGDRSVNNDPACQVNEDYAHITWPVRCQGPIGEQKCGLDRDRLADTIADVAKQEVKGHLRKQIEEKVDGPLRDVLKGFFK